MDNRYCQEVKILYPLCIVRYPLAIIYIFASLIARYTVMSPTDSARQQVAQLYGNRVRLRVCGLFREGDALLMVRHRGLGASNTFWAPPGGGVAVGETAPQALAREFREETGLVITVGQLLFVHEFIKTPLHAVELFFVVEVTEGTLRRGVDPEMDDQHQLIEEVRMMPFAEIKQWAPEDVHALFGHCASIDEVFQLRGYLS